MHSTQGQVTTPDDIRLYLETCGSGSRTLLMPDGFYLFDDFKYLAQGRVLVCYDLRNRGRSQSVSDPAKLARGIHHDVDDLDAIRRHMGAERIDIMAHSYKALAVVLYAIRYPDHVGRIVLIGPIQPDAGKQYPPHLSGADQVRAEVLAKLAQLQQRPVADPIQACREFWSVLRPLCVAAPADAHKIRWERCELPNERDFMRYWQEHLMPSIQGCRITAAEAAKALAPILIVHGIKDRNAPYGGARDWAKLLPNARLLTIQNAAHAPWIEAESEVCDAIATFLEGAWPPSAEILTSN